MPDDHHAPRGSSYGADPAGSHERSHLDPPPSGDGSSGAASWRVGDGSDGAPSAPLGDGSFGATTPPGVGPQPATAGPREPVTPQRTDRRTRRAAARSASRTSFWRELPVLLLIAFVLAFLLRTFVLQVFYIPSGSMQPTLEIDDRMVVEKVTYRFREPQRGEIVVFEGEPAAFDLQSDTLGERLVRGTGQFLGIVPASARDFVKRVIGLPGDEIRIEAGQVYVNDVLLDEPYVVFEDPSDYGPVTVPEGSLFFLGDNRPNSSDSRRSLGMVDEDLVVGRAWVIIWPLDHTGSLTSVRHEPGPPDGPGDGADD
jgi:signal peptidase I